MSNVFYMPPVTLMGLNAIRLLGDELVSRELKKALIVTDRVLADTGLVNKLTDELEAHKISYAIFDGVQPNPTEKNIDDGLALLAKSNADFVISFGGGLLTIQLKVLHWWPLMVGIFGITRKVCICPKTTITISYCKYDSGYGIGNDRICNRH